MKLRQPWDQVLTTAKSGAKQLRSALGQAKQHIVKYPGTYIGVVAILVTLVLYKLSSCELERQITDVKNSTTEETRKLGKALDQKLAALTKTIQEQNKLSIARIQVKRQTPPVRIFSEEPYGEFACLDYEIFDILKEGADRLIFSNKERNPVVNITFSYEKGDGQIIINKDALYFDKNNQKASNKNYLDYLRFEKAFMSNARLVFWDLAEDTPLLRTNPVMPVNMRYNHEKGEKTISFYNNIVRIEHWIGEEILFRLRHSEKTVQSVAYVTNVLKGKRIDLGYKHTHQLNNLEDKKRFLKSFWRYDFQGIEFREEGRNDIVSIYGVSIDLGMWTIDYPPSYMTPNLEELKEDNSDSVVTIKISVKERKRPIEKYHNTFFSRDDSL